MSRSAPAVRSRAEPQEIPPRARASDAPLSISLHPLMTAAGTDREFRELIYELTRLANLMASNQERFALFIGVTRPQFLILAVIADGHCRTVGEIATRLEVSSPFVTAEVGKLQKMGLVGKVPNEQDRRSALLELTAAGRARLDDLGPLRRLTNDLMFRSLTGEDMQRLRQIVRALLADGHSAAHELDAPHRRNERAPSLVAELAAASAPMSAKKKAPAASTRMADRKRP